ncbi:MAG: sensor histidine kinase [Spirulina sp. DLM2.Bin59]|nr:MAG: sensor histidine kinase [Spirulina sp. DLM2.Bin59]
MQYTLSLPQRGLTAWLSRLRVGRKIAAGYIIVLTVAIAGSSVGLIWGEIYQRRVWQAQEHAHGEVDLYRRLQTAVLQSRTEQQQLIALAADFPAFEREYKHLLAHQAELDAIWAELEAFHAQDKSKIYAEYELEGYHLARFLATYRDVPTAYFDQLADLVAGFGPTPSAVEVARMRTELMEFTNSPLALHVDGISEELVELVSHAREEKAVIEAQLRHWNQIRLYLLAGSISLSILIAVIWTIFASRAIAQPLQEVTKVARAVTEDGDFDRRAMVMTGDEVGTVAIALNQLIEYVKELLAEQKAATAQQLLASEKMSSLGRMVAGVAHEINNPVNFIHGNLVHAHNYVDDLFQLLEAYERVLAHIPPDLQAEIEATAEELDQEFLKTDLPKLLQSMQVGADRTRQIVLSLRNFSRLDDVNPHGVDIHACLDSTLLILNNRIKKGVEVIKYYGELPEIEGYSGSLYQVFMNLLSNALDALEGQTETPPQITLRTERWEGDQVAIAITDNGHGIKPENLENIFKTFFTTKPEGVGTGLGLAISHQIVVEKHQGSLTCASELGQQTTFTVLLPIRLSTLVKPAADGPLPEAATPVEALSSQ